MEKIETKTRQIEDHIHHFYCDDCGVYIGSSLEDYDGWCQELGEFRLKMNTPDGWYKLSKCLCDSCKNKLLTTIYDTLEAMGFKPD